MIAWRRWHFRGRVFKSRHPKKRLWCLKVQHPFGWRNGFQAGGLCSVSRSPFRHIAHGAAIEALMLVADLGGPTMLARIGVMRARNRHVERVFDGGIFHSTPAAVEGVAFIVPQRALGETRHDRP
jgi:hypothetical protein